LISNGRVQVTSAEHGHLYGRKLAIDAVRLLKEALVGRTIEGLRLDEETGDLRIETEAAALQIINLQPGYECWEFNSEPEPGWWSNSIWEA
jgi:hypothetical protein